MRTLVPFMTLIAFTTACGNSDILVTDEADIYYDVDIDTYEDEAIEDVPVQCGFTHPGFPNHDAYTETNLTVKQLGPTETNQWPGYDVDLAMELTNSTCGWARVEALTWTLTAPNSEWIENVEYQEIPISMLVSNQSGRFERAGYNLQEEGVQLFFPFRAPGFSHLETAEGFHAPAMETIWLQPGESVVISGRFDGSEGLETGETFMLDIYHMTWTDVATGNTITFNFNAAHLDVTMN